MRWLLSEGSWNLTSTDVYSYNGYGMEMNSSGLGKDPCLNLGLDILLALASTQCLCNVQTESPGCRWRQCHSSDRNDTWTSSCSWVTTFKRQYIFTEGYILASKELLWTIFLSQIRTKPQQDEPSWCQHTALTKISKSKVLCFATILC